MCCRSHGNTYGFGFLRNNLCNNVVLVLSSYFLKRSKLLFLLFINSFQWILFELAGDDNDFMFRTFILNISKKKIKKTVKDCKVTIYFNKEKI